MAATPNTQDLQEQLDSLKKDIGEVTKTLKSITESYAKEGQERVKDAVEDAGKHVKASVQKVQGEVEAHPYTSLGVAFGLGLIIGKLLDR